MTSNEKTPGFTPKGGSWTNNISWVKGYDKLLNPIQRTSVHFYDWPGKVREPRNVIEGAFILARGGALRFHLPIAGVPVKESPRLE